MADGTEVMDVPMWSTALFFVGIAIMVVACVALFIVRDPRLERWVYWLCWIVGGAVTSLSLLVRGYGTAIAAYCALLVGAVIWAFFRTNYLKIGGRIYAVSRDDRRPDPDRGTG
jgi:hypothetical protein